MYNHKRQLHCPFIRARSISETDSLLFKYATVIDALCPCSEKEFEEGFNKAFKEYAISKKRKKSSEETIKKTLDNHRTEITGSLFGMHYAIDGIRYASERTKKFLEDNDQPAFFKDWLIKMQIPSGMNSVKTYQKQIAQNLCCHPYSILLKVLEYVDREGISLLKQEVGYYIFNSADVLQGKATAEEVFDVIMNDKAGGIEPRKVTIPKGESASYNQHFGDQLRYLELANLVRIEGQNVRINPWEKEAIKAFTDLVHKPLGFDVYGYDLIDIKERRKFEEDWAVYYGKLSRENNKLMTSVEALVSASESQPPQKKRRKKNTELGDDGEQYVLQYEKNRVGAFNPRLVNKVLSLGRTKGLGYDIQSVIAEEGNISEYAKYIEVKSTKRVTAPNLSDAGWVDTVNMTRNEWIAAKQHKELYAIYRVYFIRGGVVLYIINNPYQKRKEELVDVVPILYRVDFRNTAVDYGTKEDMINV